MNYLDLARSVIPDDERNESDEKSLGRNPVDVERLKAAIVAAATVEPARFDRAEFDRLWALWQEECGP